jgi:hypothetical protein
MLEECLASRKAKANTALGGAREPKQGKAVPDAGCGGVEAVKLSDTTSKSPHYIDAERSRVQPSRGIKLVFSRKIDAELLVAKVAAFNARLTCSYLTSLRVNIVVPSNTTAATIIIKSPLLVLLKYE